MLFVLLNREGSTGLVTSSSVTMPTVHVENAPLYVEMFLPAHGWVHTPMAVSYHIRNHTTRLLELELNMEASDAFMFAGHKQVMLLRQVFETTFIIQENSFQTMGGSLGELSEELVT